MKKTLLIIGIMLILSLSAFDSPKKEKSKKETDEKSKKENTIVEAKPIVVDNKFKEDIQNSVLEFINDIKVNPDTCYIPFKK